MDRSNVVKLIKTTYTTDSLGQQIPTEIARIAYCKVRSVTQNEWFNGAQNHMKPELEVTMFKYDYEDEEQAEYNGKRYGIYRTYLGNGDNISLYLQSKAGL